MNKHTFKQPLIATGLLVPVGAVAAQTYCTHQLVRRVVTNEGAPPVVAGMPASQPRQWDPWVAMHADMMRSGRAWTASSAMPCTDPTTGLPACSSLLAAGSP